jgi:hypothetical protein
VSPHAEQGPGEAGGPADEQVGTLAEEAAKLFAALSGMAGTTREQGSDLGETVAGLGDRLADAAHDVDEHLATGAAECRYCPVCRGVDLLRRTDPDVVLHLGEAARSLSRAVAAMLATANVEEHRTQRSSGSAGVEHIDLDGHVDDGVDDGADDGADWDDLGDEPDPEQEEHQ